MGKYESDKKDDMRRKIFWLLMVGATTIMFALKLFIPYFHDLGYKWILCPIYGPVLVIVCAVLWAILSTLIKAVFNSIFRNK